MAVTHALVGEWSFSVSLWWVLSLMEHGVYAGAMFRGHGKSQHGDRAQERMNQSQTFLRGKIIKNRVFPVTHNTE